MPSRAYIAHDRIVTVGRMYLQMWLVGVIIAGAIYAGAAYIGYSRYLAEPIPEWEGKETYVHPQSSKLPAQAILKYFVSPNPHNYINFNRPDDWVEQELVEPELRVLLHDNIVPRETYLQAVRFVTHNRIDELRWIFPISLLWFPIFGTGYFFLFSWINKQTEKTEFVRGVDVMPFKELKAKLEAELGEEKTPLCLGEVLLPDAVSRRHMLVLGTSGTGKSVCLNRHIASLRQNKGTCVIYDVKGEFCGKHFSMKAGDAIFYPFDKRTVAWSFFNEVRDYPDLDILCTSLYEPSKDAKDPYWYNAARDVFRTGLFFLLQHGKKSNQDI